ncbi:acetate kinase [Secundilactobacillus paracollinoides]|uniref:Acetate kinase n=1 Tax=Secundilactobacillus paracollinoides TaxID=240427 RepID=A0A1B2J1P7_9LACO|nr:acetate kinase [Secundilactobacillus paracollinoides]ANZ62272.1 acetate kinase [Secundilactobacillus paracollinoides]ANZ63961.1 acetate kinase [Secundilactobacillus paracollinoides]ANZ68221.1 acetate kinase [Secundilactobacillus paracollinoides]KRL79435.1 acetate kinase [Secundilactobacillus paracollinoides DSM 15502 = JCM 11969]
MGKTLAVNAGSSTLKFKLFEVPSEKVLTSGAIERIGLGDSLVSIKYGDGQKYENTQDVKDHEEAIHIMLDQLLSLKIIASYDEITGVGHRVVAGGEFFTDSVLVDEDALKKIEDLSEYAPLHNPAEAMGIRTFQKILPNVPNVAVFDTSFHTTMPQVNYMYGIPYEYYEKFGARKYGAHGTSHRYVAGRAAAMLNKPLEDLKLITLHIGAGASITAIKNGKSFDTSMGFTPLAGIMMATRSGDIDASLVTFLMEKLNIKDPNDMIDILNKKSGLVGVSEYSADMRDLEKVQDENPKAHLARDMYINRIVKYVGQYIAELGGVDAIVFTAGVGENDIPIRQEVADQLSYFGIGVDSEKNNIRGVERDLSTADATVKTLLIPTNEELMIVRDVERLTK